MELIKRLFYLCIGATIFAILFVVLGPSEGLEALGGVLVAYFALLIHIVVGPVIAAKAYRIRRFDIVMFGILSYFVVIYGAGGYVYFVTSGLDKKLTDFVDSRSDKEGYELREIGEELLLNQQRQRAVDPELVQRARILLEKVEAIDASERAHKPIVWYLAAVGELDLLQTVIAKGARLDDPLVFDTSPLYEAVKNKHVEAVHLLTEAGADPNAVDHRNVPALVVATENTDMAMIDALLDAGADINMANYDGSAFAVAVRRGDVAVVRQLLKRGARPTPVFGRNAIEYALETDNQELVELLAMEADGYDARTDTRDPLLFKLIGQCELSEFTRALGLGASADIINNDGQSLIAHSIWLETRACDLDAVRAEFVATLLEYGADVNGVDKNGDSLLLVSLNKKRSEIAVALVDAGAKIQGTLGNKNFLMLAARNGMDDLIDVAIARGFDIDEWPDGLNTSSALYEAATAGHTQSVAHLFGLGAKLPEKGYQRKNLYRLSAEHAGAFKLIVDHYVASGTSNEEDLLLRRAAEDSKSESAIAILDRAEIQ